MAYTPVEVYLGDLPDASGSDNANVYNLDPQKISATAGEILVYAWVTTQGDEAFHRYYYEIETFDNSGRSYPQYMNVAATQDVVLNSSNMWMPVFPSAQSKCFTFPVPMTLSSVMLRYDTT